MSSEPHARHQRLREIFLAASELDPGERGPFLDGACAEDAQLRAEVEGLLAHDDARLVEGVGVRALEALSAEHAPTAGAGGTTGESIGGFRILSVLGSGGMGVVYEAEQESPRRTVALKVIRSAFLTPRLWRRFEHEVHVLGRLSHRGIAQIFEAGTDPGQGHGGPRPYFAMELVQGQPITRWADEHGLGLRQRLALVAEVCDAVHHAHEKGVVHRDLKPANVLVDASGQPKVLDFGIARVTDADVQATTRNTDVGEILGTLPYMSPEQVSGLPDEVDLRTDVHALGVLTYELVSGRLPLELSGRSVAEAARVLVEEEPTRLGSLDGALRGDVETIVAKALEKDKARRYPSAAELAADLRRFLDDRPVLARPVSTIYQLRRFTRRNRALVGGLALAFAILVSGTIVSTALYLEAERRRELEAEARTLADRRLKQADAARALADERLAETNAARAAEALQLEKARTEAGVAHESAAFLEGLFQFSDPSTSRGNVVPARDILDRGAARITEELKGQPEIQARLLRVMGRSYLGLGLYEEGREQLGRALELRAALGDEHSVEVARIHFSLGEIEHWEGNYAAAEPHYRTALTMQRELLGPAHVELAHTLDLLGRLEMSLGRLEAARTAMEEALAMRRALLGESDLALAESQQSLAMLAYHRGAYAESEERFRAAIALRRARDAQDAKLGELLHNLGLVCRARGDAQAGEAFLRESLALNRELLGADHPNLAHGYLLLARIHEQRGERQAQAAALEQALAVLGPEHGKRLDALNDLAALRVEQGDDGPAETLLLEVLAGYRQRLGERHQKVGVALHNLATLRERQGRLEQAVELARQAVDIGREHELTMLLPERLVLLARLLGETGEPAEAEDLLLEAHDQSVQLFGATAAATQEVAALLAEHYEAHGQAEQARAWR